MVTNRAITGGEEYGDKHLSNSDYYDENNKIVGKWYGDGAKILGLNGGVKAEEFAALMRGQDPSTGALLRMRAGGGKTNNAGEVIATQCSAIDSTVSAPKGWSVLTLRDERCAAAWDRAMENTITQMEMRMTVRDRKNGKVDVRAAMPVIARYSHDASRSLDVQIHDHLIFFNVAYDDEAQTWRALDTQQLYKHRALLTECFRAELAREAVALGYELTTNRDERGKYLGWEVEGVSKDLRDKFSERSAQKDAAIAAELSRRQTLLTQFAAQGGGNLDAYLNNLGELWSDETATTLSDNEVGQIVRDTRASKLRHISKDKVRALQEEKMSAEDKQQLEKVVADAKLRADPSIIDRETAVVENGRFVTAREAMEWGVDHVMERQTVAFHGDVLSAAMQHFRGLEINLAMQALSDLRDEGKILMGSTSASKDIEITTANQIDAETKMLALVKAGIGRYGRIGAEDFLPPPTGKENASDRDQRRVIQKILASHDGVTVFTGAAGTGKTWCAARIAEAIHAQGHKAWSLAPTASAVEELRKGGFVGAKTIALALIKEMDDKGGAQPGDFILVDESGMVGSQDMLHLLEYAHRRQARVILQGDRQQIMAVSCGDALATIEDETAVTRASLLEVRRQVPKQYKNAVKKLRRDPVGGLDALVAMGAVEQCAATNLSDELAREYFAETDKVGANGKKKDVLIVAGTHKIIDRVTTSIREERIRRGEIDTTKEVTRISLQSTQWTEAEKRLTGEYEENFVVRFQKPLGEVFERNAKAEVVGVNVKTGKIKLRHPETKTEIEVAPSVISKDCEVMRKADIKVAAGDKIMFQVNRKFPRADGKMRRCVNGEVAIVHSVDTESGDIQLKDGRILRKEFEDFCLAYANTAHKSQGKTVDSVIVAGDGLTKELFYVAVTRGRKSVKIFTQNVVDLAHKVSISGARRSATSFARDYFEDVMMRRAHDKQREVAAQGEAERAVVQAVTISPAPAAQIATLQGRSGPGGANQTRNVGGI